MKAVRFVFIILLTVLLIFGVATAQTVPPGSNSQTDNDDERYRIGFQDTIDVQVFRHPELNQRASVNADGTIILFRASKPLVAICKTERELAKDIEAEYVSFLKKPEVNVVAVEKKSQSYGVIGAVEKAGNYYFSRRIRLLELLSFAGGPNKEAGSRMIVARAGSSSACKVESDDSVITNDLVLMNFKVKEVLEGKQNLWMQPGDVVSVMDSDLVYVYGNVNKVGSVTMKEPITLTQAIVTAEGLKPTAKSQVRILRQKPNSAEREEFVYDLKDIEKRKAQDPFLEPNDIVAVSADSTKVILTGIKEIIKQGIPGLVYRF
ncbi:MAG TPA: SLBB domain-containing protein [Pyrinomonadaceae bacterium]|jgi:polysaccharide export outer membrane protein